MIAKDLALIRKMENQKKKIPVEKMVTVSLEFPDIYVKDAKAGEGAEDKKVVEEEEVVPPVPAWKPHENEVNIDNCRFCTHNKMTRLFIAYNLI